MSGPFQGVVPTQCAFKKDCPNTPLWYPSIWVFAKGYKYAPPMKSLLSMPVCEDCSQEVTIDHVVTDQGWKMITDVLEAMNKAEPDRARNQLHWWAIKDAAQGKLP